MGLRHSFQYQRVNKPSLILRRGSLSWCRLAHTFFHHHLLPIGNCFYNVCMFNVDMHMYDIAFTIVCSMLICRRPSLLVFSSTDQTQPLESNPPFSDRHDINIIVGVFVVVGVDVFVVVIVLVTASVPHHHHHHHHHLYSHDHPCPGPPRPQPLQPLWPLIKSFYLWSRHIYTKTLKSVFMIINRNTETLNILDTDIHDVYFLAQ